jgi:hypothetical protein
MVLGFCCKASFLLDSYLPSLSFPLGWVALSSIVGCPHIEADAINTDKSPIGGCANDIVAAVD